MKVRITLPLRTESKLNQHVHWTVRAKATRTERRATLYALRAALPSVKLTLVDVMGPIQIVLTRRGPTVGLDLDNLQASFKAVRDGVADWLQIDDGDPRLHWTYRQGRAASWAVVIEVQTPSDVTVLDVADELLGPAKKKTVA